VVSRSWNGCRRRDRPRGSGNSLWDGGGINVSTPGNVQVTNNIVSNKVTMRGHPVERHGAEHRRRDPDRRRRVAAERRPLPEMELFSITPLRPIS
jgi:hypothetical protein